MTLRPVLPDDAVVMSRLDPGMSAAQAEALLAKPHLAGLMAMAADKAVGFILGWVVEGDGDIVQITVDPAFRRAGIGRAFLARYLHQYCPAGCGLEVAADNFAALALYQRAGFRPAGRRPGYYRRPGARVDAILMRLDTSGGGD